MSTKSYLLFLSFSLILASCGSENATQSKTADNPTTSSTTETLSGSKMPLDAPGIVKIIDQIVTLDDLIAFNRFNGLNPLLVIAPDKDNPNFVELYKSQMKFSVYLSNLIDPNLAEIQKQESDILEGKEIWTQGMIDGETALIKALAKKNESKEEIIRLLDQKKMVFIAFQKSDTFKEYLQVKEAKLEELKKSKEKYYTPEMTELQKKITKLQK